MTTPEIFLKPKEDKRISAGHLWVFSNEIARVNGSPRVGDVVQVKNGRGESLGFGFYNPSTLIAIRIFSKYWIEPDKTFFIDRINLALSLRQRLFKDPFYRLVHGESDFLPGLIVDRYDRLFSVQILCAGIECRKQFLYDALKDLFSPAAIYERNESGTRELEGLPQLKSIVSGIEESVDYIEDGVTFRIDPFSGQKTGFYYDQRANRIFSRTCAEGLNALDLFSNEGGFALNLASAGAADVISVDSSEAAMKRLQLNAELNGFGNVHGFVCDANEFLEKQIQSGGFFDLVVCDPPSFTKNRKAVTVAKAGYRKLHENIFAVLKKGGFLLTASCSHHIFRETFEEVVHTAAVKSGRTLQLLHRAGASPDHPVLPAMPETEYLKFAAYRVT